MENDLPDFLKDVLGEECDDSFPTVPSSITTIGRNDETDTQSSRIHLDKDPRRMKRPQWDESLDDECHPLHDSFAKPPPPLPPPPPPPPPPPLKEHYPIPESYLASWPPQDLLIERKRRPRNRPPSETFTSPANLHVVAPWATKQPSVPHPSTAFQCNDTDEKQGYSVLESKKRDPTSLRRERNRIQARSSRIRRKLMVEEMELLQEKLQAENSAMKKFLGDRLTKREMDELLASSDDVDELPFACTMSPQEQSCVGAVEHPVDQAAAKEAAEIVKHLRVASEAGVLSTIFCAPPAPAIPSLPGPLVVEEPLQDSGSPSSVLAAVGPGEPPKKHVQIRTTLAPESRSLASTAKLVQTTSTDVNSKEMRGGSSFRGMHEISAQELKSIIG